MKESRIQSLFVEKNIFLNGMRYPSGNEFKKLSSFQLVETGICSEIPS